MLYTICSKYHPGVDSLLKNIESLGLSKHLHIEELSKIPDEATALIFGAWHVSYEPLRKYAKKKGIKVGYLWTSSPTETELHSIIIHKRQHELLYLASSPSETESQGEISLLNLILAMKQNNEIDFIWFAKKDFLSAFGGDGIFYAPLPLQERALRTTIPDINNISLFVPHAIKKNIYSQYLAFRAVQRQLPTLRLRTNLSFQSLLNVTSLGWMPQNIFEKEISNTYLALHVSLAESFAYGAYEFLARGIPSLISPTIAKNMNLPLETEIVVRDVDSVEEIADRIRFIIDSDKTYYKELSDTLYQAMKKLKEYNNASLKEIFEKECITRE